MNIGQTLERTHQSNPPNVNPERGLLNNVHKHMTVHLFLGQIFESSLDQDKLDE